MRVSGVKPETIRQARRWEKVKDVYLELGLCHKCAAMAAWGHQVGFAICNRPCDICLPLIEGLPREEANGWQVLRKVS